MNIPVLFGLLVLGGASVAVLVCGEWLAARRFTRIVKGKDVTGTVSARRSRGGRYPYTVFDVMYTDESGTHHTLRRVRLTGHIDVGSSVSVRYPIDHPELGAVEPDNVRSSRKQIVAVAALFATLALAISIVKAG